jgi:hypothetical protein
MGTGRRRRTEVFSLSFLDCICCGFGAVVLFYTIVAGQSGIKRLRDIDTLQAEVNRVEEEVLTGTRNLVLLRNTLEKTEEDTAQAAARARVLSDEVAATQVAALRDGATSMARREHINQLKADLRQLEEGTMRLQGGSAERGPPGQQVRAFRGTGNRVYLTGIALRGRRILVLVDRSASMMHEELDAIITLRNQPPALRRAAPKWRHTLDIVDWISTQFPPGSSFQMYGFNTTAVPLVDGSEGRWLDSSDGALLGQAVETLRGLTPEEGTSLINAWEPIRNLSPRPDQVVLITDGLPTQGRDRPRRSYVDAAQRARVFDEARRAVPDNVPIDVILMPMQGDLPAAHRYWSLARATGGSFVVPGPDWP